MDYTDPPVSKNQLIITASLLDLAKSSKNKRAMIKIKIYDHYLMCQRSIVEDNVKIEKRLSHIMPLKRYLFFK